ncbi:tail fiber domain-containing protein [Pseudomonas sp. TMW22080]|uniref:tail fiber domain-containing protein n=1 Tax=Pseudomonas sp. TMW22080 TaxID=2506432 RepID=UPI001F10E1C7|nr:tail fiber domain-containing protein [Pseudomonas sp. TMW22080]MCH4881592.1 tail fiber domain-containing protein [Pseudomonas sp. TMW22080]
MKKYLTIMAVPFLFMGLQATAHAESKDFYDFPPGWPCCPFSDANLKTNIQPMKNATDTLLQIQGVTFDWKDGDRKDIGVLAQNVQKVYPQLVREDNNQLRVDYEKLVAPLIESVREMDARIKQLEAAQK